LGNIDIHTAVRIFSIYKGDSGHNKIVEKLYFDSIWVCSTDSPYSKYGDEDYGPYIKRDRVAYQEKAKDIKWHGLGWDWDETAASEAEVQKWALSSQIFMHQGNGALKKNEIMHVSQTWWGHKFEIVDRRDGTLLRPSPFPLVGTYKV
jgi:hypothetical protein